MSQEKVSTIELNRIKTSLNRLREIQQTHLYQYEILNTFIAEINKFIDTQNIDIVKVRTLNKNDSAYLGGGGRPSSTETATMNELITKYEQIIVTLEPKKKRFQNLFGSSVVFKAINLGVILTVAGLFYLIGKDKSDALIEVQKKEISRQNEIIKSYQDTIEKIRNFNKKP
ncbi:hypothetical protein QQ054_04245 [Oscillatoria amoena NRMC-F 0135]|nr:hypothetical protein [Oscillatoria amoena NRMC-F 0135]